MNRKLSTETQGTAIITVTRNDRKSVKSANFEDAIKATGFGKFNFILICILIFGGCAQIAEQSCLSYVIPIAQCDLNLSLGQRGFLVSISYTGTIFSAFLAGYFSDTYGRRRVIAYGFIGNALCHLVSAFSQSYAMLLVTNFLSGFIYSWPFGAFLSYLTEFHSSENRSRIQLMRGLSNGVGSILLPMMGWIILPHIYEISILNITLHSWNLFIAACSIPAFITGITFFFMPESPKYLMSSGNALDALTVFKKVYNKNTGRRFSTFPVKTLQIEKEQTSIAEKCSFKEQLVYGFKTVKPLFKPPHLMRLIHTTLTHTTLSIGAFTFKMWYPQILQSINDNKHNSEANICDILNSLANQSSSDNDVCTVNLDNSSVYINAAILGSVQLVSFLIGGTIVNKIGKKPLAVILSCFSGCCPILIYLIPNVIVMEGLLPLIIAFAEISAIIIITIAMETFPTTFRSTAINLFVMISRLGLTGGNMAIPYLLNVGCFTTLLFISVSILVSTVLATMLPNTDKKDLQ